MTQYKSLIEQIRSHSSAKATQYRRSMFELNQDLPHIGQVLTDIRRRLQAACPSEIPSAVTPSRLPSAPEIQAVESLRISPTGPKELVVPQELIDEFICLADAQTQAEIETLGILAGTLDDGKLVVKGIVLPKQRGVSDMCECLDDEQLFNELLRRNWMDLGWIHTHPQHALFLSSVDLHTHAYKQQLLPESVAIVWAPTERPSLGVFHLSEVGMSDVMDCKLQGFHPHASRLYETASHVKIVPGLRYSVVNLVN